MYRARGVGPGEPVEIKTIQIKMTCGISHKAHFRMPIAGFMKTGTIRIVFLILKKRHEKAGGGGSDRKPGMRHGVCPSEPVKSKQFN
jgi:hypothetical protein